MTAKRFKGKTVLQREAQSAENQRIHKVIEDGVREFKQKTCKCGAYARVVAAEDVERVLAEALVDIRTNGYWTKTERDAVNTFILGFEQRLGRPLKVS